MQDEIFIDNGDSYEIADDKLTPEIFEDDEVYEQLCNFNGTDYVKAVNICRKKAKELGVTALFDKMLKEVKKKVRTYSAPKERMKGTLLPIPEKYGLKLYSGTWDVSSGSPKRMFNQNEVVACVHMIAPIGRLVNVETKTEQLVLWFKRGNRDREGREVSVRRSVLASSSQITSIADCGISVNGRSASALSQYLDEVEDLNYDEIPTKMSIGRFGYVDGYGFSPYVKDLVFDGDTSFKSLYDCVHSAGDYDVWKRTVAGEIKNSPIARLYVASSFASVLLEPLGTLPFFVHLWGDSGGGKTVSLMMAASVWGDPAEGAFIKSFESTTVGLEKTAAFLHNLPFCINEFQLNKDGSGKQKFSVYNLTEGQGRLRGNKRGGVDIVPTWRNTILTNGETPINESNAGGGAINRVIEIEIKPGMNIVADGHGTSNIVRGNYGFAGKDFLDRLLAGNVDTQDMFGKYFKTLLECGTTEKQAQSGAAILTADFLMREWIFSGYGLAETDVESLREFLASKDQVSVGKRAYDFLCGWVAQNSAKFTPESPAIEVYGEFSKTDDHLVAILPNVFDEVMEENKFNTRAVLAWMKQKNLLKYDNSSHSYKYPQNVRGRKTRCYGIYLPSEAQFTDTPDDGLIDVDLL